ncbi:hypothetical protein DFH08DRAFT_838677 [Mycena albidolilacea]|uniref:Uncharacterized protein n=1 Tax=Mycena albidolilacea TaxID=1033008 RepID=A0AAD7ANZ7_9AGAR|nr:hypothetical protein DFH08DRAFT_838677 [Mycena albidolilacea]
MRNSKGSRYWDSFTWSSTLLLRLPGCLNPLLMLHSCTIRDSNSQITPFGNPLLSGARYAVLTTPAHLHIYDVWNGPHIWTQALYPGTRHSVDMAPGGAILRVLLQAVPYNICIQEVDIAAGQSWEVFTFDVQDAYRARIAGDFFACNLRPLNGKMSFLLVNWPAATWTILDPGPHLPHTELLPDYVVLAYPDSAPPHQLLLAVADLHSLSPDMKPLHEFNRFDDTNRRSIRDVFVACTGLEHADGQLFLGPLSWSGPSRPWCIATPSTSS